MDETGAIFNEMGFAAQDHNRLSEAVLYSLARTFSLVSRELEAVYKRFGLTGASFNLLMLLQYGKDPASFSQRTIGQRLVVSPSDITGLVDRLEKKGLVRRTPGQDRRSHLLRITPKGVKLLDGIWPHHLETVGRLTKNLNKDDAKTLLSTLSQMRQTAAQ